MFAHVKDITSPLLGCLVMAIILNLLPGLSRSGSNFLLVALQSIVITSCITYARACGIKGDLPNPLTMLSNMWHWPSDIRTAMDQFKLGPDLVVYACCPRCYSLYCPKTKDNPQYPEFCTYQEFVGERRCHARLIHKRESGKPTVALCPFAYQPLESWLT
jgi:hypothetical protein